MIKLFPTLIILSSLLFFSCTKKIYTEESCNQLSFKSFKGSPKALVELTKNCNNIKYKFTKDQCQKILTRFILTGKQKLIVQEFGELALSCLTESDIERFSHK